jgi:glycine/D-amino acid oxidase-like deaminating enzyme
MIRSCGNRRVGQNDQRLPVLFLCFYTVAWWLAVFANIRASAAYHPLMMMLAAPKRVVVCGGGIQGTSVAYQIAERDDSVSVTILEAKAPASAASGKGGGFMARSWGDGSCTQRLHELAFDMYGPLALELGCESYRKLPVLSVSPGIRNKQGVAAARSDRRLAPVVPSWLDGAAGQIRALGMGDDTAQITPAEFVSKMLDKHRDRIQLVLGTCSGIETSDADPESRQITTVTYVDKATGEPRRLPCDAFVVSNGPWACQAEEWFEGTVQLPMEGVKSTSVVWEPPSDGIAVDATALFCGEDSRFGTHLEVYPRPDGTVYICGIGGSDYVPKDALKGGAFREQCEPNESRVEAAVKAFTDMSKRYGTSGKLAVTQACMRPCPPDALPYMGKIPGYRGAYINAGHNCWYVRTMSQSDAVKRLDATHLLP